jgi:tetratricopeptide (TPR) repeat protein
MPEHDARCGALLPARLFSKTTGCKVVVPMRRCLVLVLLLAACGESSGNTQTAADRDHCLQYDIADAASAVDACTRLLQAPDARLLGHEHAYRWRALAFMDLREWERAKADFQKLLELDPSNTFAADRLRYIEALQSYELRTGSPAIAK